MKTLHLASYYRPQSFAELKGQEHIKTTLSLSASQGAIAPAYLFSGTRGVGKTSVARIFAKAINCRNAPCEEPCNRCDICEEITRGISVDVLEIDGASHTGVEHVRKLIEDISLSPVKCPRRVVIIDEVHMLSRSAFNALLKTLEEPPSHVVFILATTEPHKIPDTIISRCQHFVFRKLTEREVVSHLKSILEREKVPFEEDALVLLAKRGGGSVRDSLSMLSQILAVGREGITSSVVRDVLGLASFETQVKLIEAIACRDVRRIILEIEALLSQGIDILYFLEEMTHLWRDMFIFKVGGEKKGEDIVSLSKKFSLSHVHGAWQMLLDAQSKIDRVQDPALFLELVFMNITFLPELLGQRESSFPSVAREGGKNRSPATKTMKRGWGEFLNYLKKEQKLTHFPHINLVKGYISGSTLVLECPSVLAQRLKGDEGRFALFREEIKRFWGDDLQISFVSTHPPTKASLKEKVLKNPLIKAVMDELEATVVDVYPRDVNNNKRVGEKDEYSGTHEAGATTSAEDVENSGGDRR